MHKEPIYWTTKSGVKINVDHMDLNHLRNTLKMIIKNSAISTASNVEFVTNQINKNKIILNGDMAEQFHETYLSHEDDDRFDDDYPCDIINEF